MRNKRLQAMAEGAVLLALALVFNALKLFKLPNGGSVDLAMIPVFLFALRWGVGWGLLEGFLFGLLQMFIDGAVAWGWQSLLLDYLVAFTPLGLAGLFRGKGRGIYVGILLGCFLRFMCTSSAASLSMPSPCRRSSSAASTPARRPIRWSTTAATCSSIRSSASSSSACSTGRSTSTYRPGTSGPERKGRTKRCVLFHQVVELPELVIGSITEAKILLSFAMP